jgi:hypothetical protein
MPIILILIESSPGRIKGHIKVFLQNGTIFACDVIID